MRTDRYLIMILAFFSIWELTGSCSRDLPLPDIKNGEKIVMLGELVAGDSVNIRAGRSIPLSSSSSLTFQPLGDLVVSLKDASGGAIALSFQDDYLADQLHTNAFVSSQTIKDGYKYDLTATHATLGKVTSIIPVPHAFQTSIADTATLQYGGDTVVRFDVRIDDHPGSDYYVIEALKQRMIIFGYFFYQEQWMDIVSFKPTYDSLVNAGVDVDKKFDTIYQEGFLRLPIFTNDQHSENFQNGGQYTVCRRVLLKDVLFDGRSYTSTVFVDRSGMESEENTNKGRVLLRVRSVSPDYFNFLKAYEQYEPVTGLGVNQLPVKIPGNITNGLGMIGGVYQHQFIYIFDHWLF